MDENEVNQKEMDQMTETIEVKAAAEGHQPARRAVGLVNRSGWQPGPWDDEPDRVEFETEEGFPGIVLRQESGHLCGYVGVPPGNPYHGKGDRFGETNELRVHGGITYGKPCEGRVCHVPKPGESENLWWLGFDAAHAGDFRPGDFKYGWPVHGDSYKTVGYMRIECEQLARQLAGKERDDGVVRFQMSDALRAIKDAAKGP